MEKQIRKIIYLVISLLWFGLLFYFCIILDSIVVIDYDESYLLDFYDNLDRLALNQNKEVDELTLVQKSACLIDSLLGTEAWVLKTIKYIDEIDYSEYPYLIERLINKSEIKVIKKCDDLLVINILVDILQNYKKL